MDYLAKVTQDGYALQHVPKASRTPELCLVAVTQNGYAIRHAPKHLCTPELYLAAVTQNGYALECVPKASRTPELCLAAVTQNGYALQHVPEASRTPELCLVAVTQNGYAIRHVPEAVAQWQTLAGSQYVLRYSPVYTMVNAGCRWFTIPQALAHWGALTRTDERAKVFLTALAALAALTL